MQWLILLAVFGVCVGQRWTEADERRRIAQIKAEEMRQFKMAGGMVAGDYEESGMGARARGTGFDYSAEMYAPSYKDSYPPKETYPRAPTYRPSPPTTPFPTLPPRGFVNSPAVVEAGNVTQPVHWCFYCTSPLRVLSEPMQQAVQNLLDVRRARLPGDFVVPDCHQPANIRTLPKQQCRASYCQTLVLTEHERGVSFAIRGCAESFGSIDEKVLEERGDNQCMKLHANLDLRECVCKHRKYCYKGAADSRIDRASQQTVLFPAAQLASPAPALTLSAAIVLSFVL